MLRLFYYMPDLKQIRKYWESKIQYPEQKQLNISQNNIPEELTTISNTRNKIDQNLEQLKYNNFWTQPYSNFQGKQAVDLANNLTKEATYTAAGELLLGKLAQGVNKLIPKKSQKKRFIDITLQTPDNIDSAIKDKLILEKENALKYLNSTQLQNQLQKIDRDFNTKYVEALDLLKEKGIKINFNPELRYRNLKGEFRYNISNILDLDKQYINIGPDFTYSTMLHEIKHQLEHLEAGLRTKTTKFNNSVELDKVLRSNPRNKQLFDDNLNHPRDIIKNMSENNPDREIDEIYGYIQYIENPTEINSQLTPLVQEQILNKKYTKNLLLNDLDKYSANAINKGEPDQATILKYFIKDKNQFLKDWSKYKYITPLVLKYEVDTKE